MNAREAEPVQTTFQGGHRRPDHVHPVVRQIDTGVVALRLNPENVIGQDRTQIAIVPEEEAICRPFGIEPPIYRRRVDFFSKSRAFDISRARAELGYSPAVGLRQGIRRTLEWYRREGWL